jgi:hypothetical protein
MSQLYYKGKVLLEPPKVGHETPAFLGIQSEYRWRTSTTTTTSVRSAGTPRAPREDCLQTKSWRGQCCDSPFYLSTYS